MSILTRNQLFGVVRSVSLETMNPWFLRRNDKVSDLVATHEFEVVLIIFSLCVIFYALP